MSLIRIDKFLSAALSVSRADAKKLISKKRITADGKIVSSSDYKVDEEKSEVTADGKILSYKKYVYLVMNKPKGVLSASTDKRKKTVMDLVDEKYKKYNLSPVGRLDKDTTGLIILTNDGDFLHRVISPKSNIEKTYYVILDGEMEKELCDEFKKGVILSDGTVLKSAKLEIVKKNEAIVTISEGKYHQIKRMFGVYDLGVNELKRLSIGKFYLPNGLKEGESAEYTYSQLEDLIFSE